MSHTISASWNQLLPELRPSTPTISSVVTRTKTRTHHDMAIEEDKDRNNSTSHVTLSEWETEALRRYRELESTLTNTSPQSEYISSNTSNGALLQLILRSKLLPIADWRECAQVVVSWFQGPNSSPLGLLSYAVTHLILAHRLRPCNAAKWILDLSKLLLITDTDTTQTSGLVSIKNWAFAAELERSVYMLQSNETSKYNTFSSLLLGLMLDDMFSSTDKSDFWGILSFCFLLRRNKNFVQSVWESDEKQQCIRMQRACELGRQLPTHIAAVLTAVV